MKHIHIILISIIVLLSLILVSPVVYNGFFTKNKDIRESVFSGSWYPSDKNELANLVDSYLNNAQELKIEGEIKAIIVPHAGYVYSGQIAATAFKQLEKEYDNIFLIGPSHRYALTNSSISGFKYYSTPLGKIKLSKKAQQMLKEELINNIEEAHEQEHALEVELPFLQRQLKNFEIIPILVGSTDTNGFKDVLSKYLGEEDLIVASVDLSHYHEYNEAVQLDSYTIEKILNLDDEAILYSEIDAPWAISSLLKIAKEKSWKPYLIAYANSGDITGNKESVVGYSSIIFVETFSEIEKQFLLELARKSAETYLKKGEKLEINEKEIPERLKIKKGCFVTFTKSNQLRGCIGDILPQVPLYECVIENSINAAVNDGRFNPMVYREMEEINIDISILTIPILLEHRDSEELLAKLKSFEQGVVLKRGLHQSTYLPIVWEQIPYKQDFLSNLCIKGQMEADCWEDSETEIYVYTAEDFAEQ